MLRGMNASLHLAKARVYQAIGLQDEADEEFLDAELSARDDGQRDFHSPNVESIPMLYVQEPFLLRAYDDAQSFFAELEEMSFCHGCNNGTGAPCPSHG